MWTLIVTTLVFAGGDNGGVSANTVLLDFPDEANVPSYGPKLVTA